MPELERLRADHAPAVLAFERANRSYFARSVSDRGEEYFAQFAARHAELLGEQEAGVCAFYLLVADDGSVLGRFNLRDIADGTAEVGYRVAEAAVGRGVATAGVERLCREASGLGVRMLRAATSDANLASQRVLVKAGFVRVGAADPDDVGGRPGSWYERRLAAR
ncbi:GNAT family N-acetyltransferase [Phycicoccus sonneratiae]|uniref:GNAT family N-acetyltransferase n=1 Tax=Phycicoccus sonneratiae TaxID=2807628 RepID=A0ABS2CJ57_9MICO|nr:GNAT family N-acetyltransferase [Phycicoccus sonneraticus]MBM6399878.1 GNAT family N-acetyltransferase [Phycicoccus sonneraticus]